MTMGPTPHEIQCLTDDELMRSARVAILRERDAQLAVLYHLNEIEKRGLHLRFAFSSIYAYAQEKLGYSSGAAHRRIASARALERYPSVHEALKTGRLTLTTASILAGALKDLPSAEVEDLVNRAGGKPQEEVQALVATLRPRGPVRERIVPIAIARAKPHESPTGVTGTVSAVPSSAQPPGEDRSEAIPSPGQESPQEVAAATESPAALSYLVRFSFDSATRERFERARQLLSGRFAQQPTIEQVFGTLLDDWLDRHDPQKRHERRERSRARKLEPSAIPNPTVNSPVALDTSEAHAPTCAATGCAPGTSSPKSTEDGRSRHVPATLRDEVFVRDQGRCTYVGPDGRRCNATRSLEIEHREPFARGGETSASNCALYCHAHNQLAARMAFGDAWIDAAIARRQRTREEDAVSTNGVRTSARDAPAS